MNKYKYAIIFTKKGNLVPFYAFKFDGISPNCPAATMEREVQCIMYYRWDNEGFHCLIKCPINPLPVKGEFTAPSLNVVKRWFLDNSWTHKATIPV